MARLRLVDDLEDILIPTCIFFRGEAVSVISVGTANCLSHIHVLVPGLLIIIGNPSRVTYDN